MKKAYIILPAVILVLFVSGCAQQQTKPSPVATIQSTTPTPATTQETTPSPAQGNGSISTPAQTTQSTPTPQATPLTRKTSYSIVSSVDAQINISDVKLSVNSKQVVCDPVFINISKKGSAPVDMTVTGLGNFVLENVLNEYYVTKAGEGITIGGGVITAATDIELSEVVFGSSKCALQAGQFKIGKGGTNIIDVKGMVKSGPVELNYTTLTPTPTAKATPTPVPTAPPVQRAFEFSIQKNQDLVDTFCPGITYIITVNATKGSLSLPGTFKISQGSVSTEANITKQSSCSVENKTCSTNSLQASSSLATGQKARLSFTDSLGTGGVDLDVVSC